jgi:cephalosporin hydroxylase
MSQSLVDIGLTCKTDKAGIRGQKYYCHVYQNCFEQFRNKPITLIEFGVNTGNSIRMWLEYFPNAQIVGVDLLECPEILIDMPRYTHIQGNQTDKVVLKIINTLHPTIIIDDASHCADDQMITLSALFPAVQLGGYFCIEDLAVRRKIKHEMILSQFIRYWSGNADLYDPYVQEHLDELDITCGCNLITLRKK